MRVVLSIASPQGHICVPSSSSSRLLVYLLLLPGRSRSPARNRGFSGSRSPLVRANTFSFLYVLLTPRKSLTVPPLSPCILALVYRLFYPFFFFCLAPLKLLYGQYLFLVSSYILPYFLDYAIPPYSSSPFRCFLPYSPISYSWQPFFLGIFLTLWCHFNFLTPLIMLRGYISNFALNTVLFVVLQHPSTFF